MKQPNLFILLFIVLIFSACSSDDSDNTNEEPTSETVKLISKITITGENNYSLSFLYNSENQIDRIVTSDNGNSFIKQYYYENGILDRAEFQDSNGMSSGSIEKYIYDNGQLTKREDYFNNTTLDETFEYTFTNGLVTNIKYFGFNETSFSTQFIFEYDSNKNVLSINMDDIDNSISDEELTFTYDDRKNPFLHFEPKIVLIDDFFSFNNNAITSVLRNLSNNSIVTETNYMFSYDEDDYPTSRTDGIETLNFEYISIEN